MVFLAQLAQRVMPAAIAASIQTCSLSSCARTLLAKRRGSVTLNGAWYCSAKCVGIALRRQLAAPQIRSIQSHRHRLPLGLLLLEQDRISTSQLEASIAYKREHPEVRIGRALHLTAGLSEDVIARTVAAQWGCPSFSPQQVPILRDVQLPYALLEPHEALPLYWDARTRNLLLGFLSGLDYLAVAAIESVMRCTVKPCIMPEGIFKRAVLELSETNPQNVAIFPPCLDREARARIVRNYLEETGTQEVRWGTTSCYQWFRLQQPRVMDLLFASPAYADAAAAL